MVGDTGRFISRRGALGALGAMGAMAALSASRSWAAAPDGLGVQLWMVRQSLAADPAGTLHVLGRAGIGSVELAGPPPGTISDFRAQLSDAGLRCTSAHLPLLVLGDAEIDDNLRMAASLGLDRIFCPVPGFDGIGALSPPDRLAALMRRGLSVDDWHWNAERLNWLAERARESGIRIGYHNHNFEFAVRDGGDRPIDILLGGTDAALVDFQIDVGNAVLGGGDPFGLVEDHPGRFKSAHIKDWHPPLVATTKPASPPSAPFGEGVIDWTRWTSVAIKTGIEASFIERENLSRDQELAAVGQAVAFLRQRP